MARSCLRQTDLRGDAQSQSLLLTVESIVVTPVAPAVRMNDPVEAVAVDQFQLLSRPFGAAHHRIRQYLLVQLAGISVYQQIKQQQTEIQGDKLIRLERQLMPCNFRAF